MHIKKAPLREQWSLEDSFAVLLDDLVPYLDYLHSSWYVLFYIGKVLAVFVICSAIELLRKRYIEQPLAVLLDRCWPLLQRTVSNVQARWGRW